MPRPMGFRVGCFVAGCCRRACASLSAPTPASLSPPFESTRGAASSPAAGACRYRTHPRRCATERCTGTTAGATLLAETEPLRFARCFCHDLFSAAKFAANGCAAAAAAAAAEPRRTCRRYSTARCAHPVPRRAEPAWPSCQSMPRPPTYRSGPAACRLFSRTSARLSSARRRRASSRPGVREGPLLRTQSVWG
jgi:hypothetical protein